MCTAYKIKNLLSIVVSNKQIADQIYEIILELPSMSDAVFKPGQFAMLDIPSTTLRRPFVIVDKPKENQLSLIYQLRGSGTKSLSSITINSKLQILTPIGSAYPEPDKNKIPVLIAGGIGIVTVYPLAKYLNSIGLKPIVVIGAKTINSIMLTKEFKKIATTYICTDDGSEGFKGNVLELAKKEIFGKIEKEPEVFACGPHKMLEFLSKHCNANSISCYISMEERMACGVGACVACVVKTTDGLKRACKDGPVFDSKKLIWE